MKHWRFFDESTGLIHPILIKATSETDAQAFPVPPGHRLIEGALDHLSQKIDIASGSVVDYQPPAPSPRHEWSAATKRWVLSATVQQSNEARAAAQARIAVLEAAQHRPLRELALNSQNTDARKRIEAIESAIAELRGSMTDSHARN